MRSIRLRIAFSIMALAMFSGLSYSQDKVASAAVGSKYVISAKAGGVNFIEGSASVTRKMGRSGFLVKGDNLGIGDRVSTGADGKIEILLNPGSYLRLGSNTEFEFISTELENLDLLVASGSAIMEVFADNDFRVKVSTPTSSFYLVRTGVYRVDVAKDGSGKIEVWKGRSMVGDADKIVKAGYKADTKGRIVETAKFDRDDMDPLDAWSKARSKELSKMIASLDRRNVRTSLMRSFLGRGWNMYDSYGLWVFDPFRGAYCFLPFGYGWSSPYGYGYGRWINWYKLPPVIYNPPVNSPTTPTTGPVTKPRTRRQASSEDIPTYKPVPVFSKIESSGNGGRGFEPPLSKPSGGRGYEPSPSPSSGDRGAPTYVPSEPTRSTDPGPRKKP